MVNCTLSTPGLDFTRLFISLTAGAGTRCMSLLSSPPSLSLCSWQVKDKRRLAPARTAVMTGSPFLAAVLSPLSHSREIQLTAGSLRWL